MGAVDLLEGVKARRGKIPAMKKSILALLLALAAPAAGGAAPDAQSGIDAFNRAVIDSTKKMDNAASLALWDEGGISILPNSKPLSGKPAIAKFLETVAAETKGAAMQSFTMECATIAVSGDLATERCVEHQVVKLPGDKPPFDGWGNLLYVLHRGGDGGWKIRAEMWSPALPGAKP